MNVIERALIEARRVESIPTRLGKRMDAREYRTVDKSSWERGPWDGEPDKMQWQDEATKLPCLIVRGPSGALCGYVGVPNGHRFYGLSYSEPDVQVHCGLTFASKCHDGGEAEAICHAPAPGESDDVWWLGFDCAHGGDVTPASDSRLPKHLRDHSWNGRPNEYRDVAFVRAEVASLATQLAAAA